MELPSIRIVNNTGISMDTKVFNAETGQELHGVRSIEIAKLELAV